MSNSGRVASLTRLFGLLVVAGIETGCGGTPKLGEALSGLTKAEMRRFERGQQVFERVFTAENGLGPLFNADACSECHEDPVVGGTGDEIELHAAAPQTLLSRAPAGEDLAPKAEDPVGKDRAPAETGIRSSGAAPSSGSECDLLFDRGGPVYQLELTQALKDATGLESEPVPAGAATAKRTIPDVFGFGLLDAVPDSTLLALADPDDADGDGISGRVNRFQDGRIGRFGRKAFVPTLAEFNAGAFQIEQGITNSAAPDEGTLGGQPLPAGVDPAADPELGDEDVRAASDYVAFLAPPAPAHQGGNRKLGEKVFTSIGCAACHVPVLRTGKNEVAALSKRKVRAYTDLLLHDMGPELADICFGEASPSEFRTEPLMGLRLSSRFLHDGRATSIEEAIRLHGGEATATRTAFLALPKHKRQALLAFLKSL